MLAINIGPKYISEFTLSLKGHHLHNISFAIHNKQKDYQIAYVYTEHNFKCNKYCRTLDNVKTQLARLKNKVGCM